MRAEQEAHFELFVAASSDDLLRIGYLLTADRRDAEELLLAALRDAHHGWSRISADDPYRRTRRLLLALATHRFRRPVPHELVAVPAGDLGPYVEAHADADRNGMTAALAALPADMRAVLVLRYSEELDARATAEALGCPVAAVAGRTSEGLARLWTALAGPQTPAGPAPAADLDVEATLRQHLAEQADRLPPAPRDLAARARAAHRRRRRTAALAFGGTLAAALALAGHLVLGGPGSDAGGPEPTAAGPATSLYEAPPRGSLAADREWLAGVAAREWGPADGTPSTSDPPVASHRVVYAGTTSNDRIALVLGRGAGTLSAVWFTGPTDATPAQMTPATAAAPTRDGEPLALLDVPDAASAVGVLVVVGRAGDVVQYTDDPTGRRLADIRAADGVAIATVRTPVGRPASMEVRILRNRQEAHSLRPTLTQRAATLTATPLLVSDPRGLRGTVDGVGLQRLAQDLEAYHGVLGSDVDPVLLATGRVSDGEFEVVLLGLVLPSGATVAWVGVDPGGAGVSSRFTTSWNPVPAGIPLLDQVLAVPVTGGGLAVSAPTTGATAEVVDRTGTVVSTLPLVAGAGVGDVPPGARSVRILSASGAVLASAPLAGAGG